MLADDELPVRKLVSETLHRSGCVVLEAHSGPDAVAVSDGRKGPIDLLVVDYEMPGMSGLDLAEQLRLSRPELPVILMSGSAEGIANSHIRGWPFIRKPFAPAAITDLIEKTLGENGRPLGRTAS